MNMNPMKDIFSDLCRNRVSNEGAEKRLAKMYNKTELAEFIVDAFQRNWISNFNMGINEDGERMDI